MMTFAQLIKEYSIVIPIIQRDYAQGRKDSRASFVRENLIEHLAQALQGEHTIDFDFVYGTIEERNGQKVLLPLDGQQRLTTLFLLHWYFNIKEDGDFRSLLEKFSYETRLTARDFLMYLTKEKIDFQEFNEKTISKVLQAKKWYQYHWEYDPTIKGMLVMLDAIHETFGQYKDNVLDRLAGEDCPIIFTFKDLETFQLGEELYIKMNARGRILSNFENFKAQFEQLLESWGFVEQSKDFSSKIDGEWTDLLWPFLDNSKTLDAPFMRLFNFVTSAIATKQDSIPPDIFTKNYNNIKELEMIYKDSENVSFLFDVFSLWKEAEEIRSEISEIHQKIPLFTGKKNYFEMVVKGELLAFPDRIYLYTIIQAKLHKRDDTIDLLRIVRNVVNRIRQARDGEFKSNLRYDSVARVFNFVDLLVQSDSDVYSAIQNIESFPRISDVSLKHEKDKAVLIERQPDLKELLFKLEDIPYLKGALMILFPLFKKYPDELYFLMTELLDGDADQSLVSRAFLTFGDYAHHIGYTNLGPRYIFGGTSIKEFLWTAYDEELQEIYESFLEKLIHMSEETLEQKLKKLIEQSSKWTFTDWAYYFVKYPAILQGGRMTFAYEDEDDELLIERMNGVSLQAEHINPIYAAVIEEIPQFCNAEESYVRLSNRSKLVMNVNIIFWLEDGQWCTDCKDPLLNKQLEDIQEKEQDLVQQAVQMIILVSNQNAVEN
ncbi:DUF262 domain-containing protein [Metabacillus fastidiosus]|uniref:DUF262 domain-containing protein n=1 Tax=Metabacillus fastidiosus TaxID=1458 RepID=UPI002E1BC467|nr:DUF262 domain-containing protein [Metabacillus fastidiosus]